MGAFIGDALGLGPHWYYDLAVLHRDYGDWIAAYTDPKPGRYHSGLRAGQLSQGGILLSLTLRSLVERDGYESQFSSTFGQVLAFAAEASTWVRVRSTAAAATSCRYSTVRESSSTVPASSATRKLT